MAKTEQIKPDTRDGVPWCQGSCPSAQSVSGIVQCKITAEAFPSVCLPLVRSMNASRAELRAARAGLQRMRERILAGPPDVSWTVGNCTMLAEPRGPNGEPIAQLFAEWMDNETARGTVRTEPDRELVADVTIHAPHDREISDEARDVLCALFWSWWRAAIARIQDEPGPLDREPKQGREPETCPQCGGRMAAMCTVCRGTGIRPEQERALCYYCGGTGELHDVVIGDDGEPEVCDQCDGAGFLPPGVK